MCILLEPRKASDGLTTIVTLPLTATDLPFSLVEWYLNTCVNSLTVARGLANVSVPCSSFSGT